MCTRAESGTGMGYDLADEVFSKQEIVRASFLAPSAQNSFSTHGPDAVEGIQRSTWTENITRESIYSRILMLKEKADAYFNAEDYDDALLHYREIFIGILGNRKPLEHRFYNEGYIDTLQADRKKAHRIPMFLTLVSCCNSIAEIYRIGDDYSSAIDWLEEVEVLYDCFKMVYPESHPVFSKAQKTLEYVTYHMKAALQLVRIFSDLQNTSSAAYFSYLCVLSYPLRYSRDIQEISEVSNKCDAAAYFSLRHPDPTHVDTLDVKDPSLQIRGIWSKLTPLSRLRPTKRHHRVSWMWRDKIYLVFGIIEKDCAADGDAWCIDLRQMAKWRRLPGMPTRLQGKSAFAEKAVVFNDRAWFFCGGLELLRFDMITETWDIVRTYADFKLPYGTYPQFDSYVVLYGHKLCVFSGARDYIMLKKRAFILLNLRTLRWENLLKDLTQEEMNKLPSPRYCSIAWVSTKEDRVFFLYGCEYDEKSINTPEMLPVGKSNDYCELWSYSFGGKVWNRERLRGNYPCHRINAAYAYHEKRDKLILFGGGAPDVPSFSVYSTDGNPKHLAHSTFADTFVLNLTTRSWQQVVTRNFPAWRSTAVLMIDDIGRIFLHGGMTFRNFHLDSSENEKSLYIFTDIWRLDIDFPDTPIDERSFRAQSSLFKAGSWRKCCVCKRIGTGYLRCEGTCGGDSIYCSVACQRSSWRTHRAIYGCRKSYDNEEQS